MSSPVRHPRSQRVVAARGARRRGLGQAPLPFDFVESKIHPPALRPGMVSRTALVNRLRATGSAKVATVTAPAGYGKTALLAQWAARDPRPFAWLFLDERDNDPVVLLRHVAAALHAIEPLNPRVLESLASLGASVWARVVPRLGAALSAFAGPIVIVLSDAHVLSSAGSLEAVSAVAEHAPDGSLLVLSSRVAPKLPLAALRAAGELFELESADLAMSPREGQLLLRSAGVDATLAEATELVRRCEGWPAAVYLSGLARRDHPAAKPVSFDGVDRDLEDYIQSEYLSHLRPPALRFLQRTSVLDRMCGALCDAILRRKGSAGELQKIERANLFLVPLDRERIWYRYHQLFRDVLRRELFEREPDLVPVLHRRAADWYETRGDPESALEHAAAAGDMAHVARILTVVALPTYYDGRLATVERWLARFDDPVLLKRFPAVALQGSWVHALRGRPVEAEKWLQIAESGRFRGRLADGSTSLQPWIAVVRGGMARGGVDQMLVDAQSALAALPHDSQLRPSALIILGAARLLLGESDRADAIFADAASEADRLGATDSRVIAISERSLVASAQDDPNDAEAFALEAHELVHESHLDGYVTSAIALAASARASLRHGRWDDARTRLAEVQKLRPLLTRAVFPWFTVQARLEVARAYLALRDVRSARMLLDEIDELLGEHPNLGVLVDQAKALERELEAMPQLTGAGGAGLTAAELRLLPLLTTHLSFREIGEQLFVSRNTIKTQAISVYRKLGVSSRSEAISRAADLGLVELGKHVV